MAREADCSAEFHDQAGPGTLSLDEQSLRFSGAFELTIPVAAIDLLRVHRGVLEVTWPDGTAAFDLGGRYAQDWADLIRGPRPLIDKLGVRRGARCLVFGVTDFGFRRQLQERAVVLDRSAIQQPGVDLIFLGAQDPGDLAHIPSVTPLLAQNGAIWVIRPAAGPAAADVTDAARSAGLAEIKVVDFGPGQTAHKLVFPAGH
jgi:hypothetical protein